jgi:hypothetical protein
MQDADRIKLLHGPYKAPDLRRGDKATCLFRDTDVIITSWSDARIPWPRCKVPGQRGGSGLLVEGELARAVRSESRLAIMSWWDSSSTAVYHWRQALGVEQWGTEGSRRLHQEVSEAGAERTGGKKLPPDQVERRRQTALELNLGQYLQPGAPPEKLWTAKELALLGTLPDDKVARRTKRTPSAVRQKREELSIPNPTSNRWSVEELDLLGTLPDREVARRIGRSLSRVTQKRCALGIPNPHDGRLKENRT